MIQDDGRINQKPASVRRGVSRMTKIEVTIGQARPLFGVAEVEELSPGGEHGGGRIHNVAEGGDCRLVQISANALEAVNKNDILMAASKQRWI
jgi:hypothetical protein